MAQSRFTDRINIKAKGKTFLVVDNVASIEKESRFDHGLIYFPEIQFSV